MVSCKYSHILFYPGVHGVSAELQEASVGRTDHGLPILASLAVCSANASSFVNAEVTVFVARVRSKMCEVQLL